MGVQFILDNYYIIFIYAYNRYVEIVEVVPVVYTKPIPTRIL